MAAPPHLPWTHLLSSWGPALTSITTLNSLGNPHLQGAVSHQGWGDAHFGAHTDRVQIPASPPPSPVTLSEVLSFPESQLPCCRAQLKFLHPKLIVGIKCQGRPRHRGDWRRCLGNYSLHANSLHAYCFKVLQAFPAMTITHRPRIDHRKEIISPCTHMG